MLPFMDGEDDLGLPQAPGIQAELTPGLRVSRLDLRERTVVGADLTGAILYQPLMSGLTLEGATLTGAELRQGRLDHLQVLGSQGKGLTLTVASAEGATLKETDLEGARLIGVHGRDITLEGVVLEGATLTLCHLFGGRWRDVNAAGATLSRVNLSFSTLRDVDFTGADLRGCTFAHSDLKGVNLEGSLCEGADFRGVTGLTPAQRQHLAEGGARLRGSASERAIAGILQRLVPRLGPEGLDRGARALTLALQGAAILLALGLTLALFWDRVTPPAGSVTMDDGAPPVKEQVTAEEITQTKANLARLREAIQAAHATTERYGIAAYPSLEDLGDNTFDRDGAGPGTERLTLVEGGLPLNLLTGGEAVLPYCNDPPAQETLSGDDSDWHYCDQTGRIFACGGFTDLPTLSW